MKLLKLLILCLSIILLSTLSNAQLNPECNNIIGQAVNQPSGGGTCIAYPLNPDIPLAGTPVTRCFSYQFTGPVNLGYLLITGQCGPFPLYNTLSYTIYNAACDTLITSGNIFPFNINNDTFIDELIPNEWYIICYHWVANCPQTDACPIIYTSLLPIEMKEFYVDYLKSTNENVLYWSTYTEINNNYFNVERSFDGITWETLKTIPGAGNSTNIKNYHYTDSSPIKGANYYRLKQVDYNGKFEYSSIVFVNTIIDEDMFVLLPNPVENILYVESVSNQSKSISVIINNQIGTQIYINKNVTIEKYGRLEINTKSYAYGMYFIRIIDNVSGKHIAYKFIKN